MQKYTREVCSPSFPSYGVWTAVIVVFISYESPEGVMTANLDTSSRKPPTGGDEAPVAVEVLGVGERVDTARAFPFLAAAAD